MTPMVLTVQITANADDVVSGQAFAMLRSMFAEAKLVSVGDSVEIKKAEDRLRYHANKPKADVVVSTGGDVNPNRRPVPGERLEDYVMKFAQMGVEINRLELAKQIFRAGYTRSGSISGVANSLSGCLSTLKKNRVFEQTAPNTYRRLK